MSDRKDTSTENEHDYNGDYGLTVANVESPMDIWTAAASMTIAAVSANLKKKD